MKLSFIQKLDTRERLLILYTTGGFLLFLFFLGFLYVYNLRQNLAAEAKESGLILVKLGRLREKIIGLAPEKELPDRNKIFSQINEILKKYDLRPISINEQKKKKKKSFQLAIRLQSVSMPNLLSFIYDVEYQSNSPLSISSLLLRTTVGKKDFYDVNLTVSLEGKIKDP